VARPYLLQKSLTLQRNVRLVFLVNERFRPSILVANGLARVALIFLVQMTADDLDDWMTESTATLLAR
jgi:hypothetical protein